MCRPISTYNKLYAKGAKKKRKIFEHEYSKSGGETRWSALKPSFFYSKRICLSLGSPKTNFMFVICTVVPKA